MERVAEGSAVFEDGRGRRAALRLPGAEPRWTQRSPGQRVALRDPSRNATSTTTRRAASVRGSERHILRDRQVAHGPPLSAKPAAGGHVCRQDFGPSRCTNGGPPPGDFGEGRRRPRGLAAGRALSGLQQEPVESVRPEREGSGRLFDFGKGRVAEEFLRHKPGERRKDRVPRPARSARDSRRRARSRPRCAPDVGEDLRIVRVEKFDRAAGEGASTVRRTRSIRRIHQKSDETLRCWFSTFTDS